MSSSARPRPLVVTYHLGLLPSSVRSRADQQAIGGTPFTKAYAEEGRGVVPRFAALGEGTRPIILVGWSEGVQGLRAHIRDGRALASARLLGVVALDGAHASVPPDDRRHLQPWRDLSRWGRPWVMTSTRIQTQPDVMSTRSVIKRLFNVDSDGEHRVGAGRLVLTAGAGVQAHEQHAAMAGAEVTRILDAYDAGKLDGGGPVASLAVLGVALAGVYLVARALGWRGGVL